MNVASLCVKTVDLTELRRSLNATKREYYEKLRVLVLSYDGRTNQEIPDAEFRRVLIICENLATSFHGLAKAAEVEVGYLQAITSSNGLERILEHPDIPKKCIMQSLLKELDVQLAD